MQFEDIAVHYSPIFIKPISTDFDKGCSVLNIELKASFPYIMMTFFIL